MDRPSLRTSLVTAVKSFQRHKMTDWAAAMTYYLVMALFPGLLVAVSVLGLVGQQAMITDATGYLEEAGAPEEVVSAVEASLRTLIETSGAQAGTALVIGLVLGLNGASGAFGAAGRALNVVYAVDEDRGFVRKKLVDVAWTIVVIGLGIVSLVSVFIGGEVAEDLFGKIGLGETVGAVWTYVRWFVAIVTTVVAFGLVYAFGPDREERRFRWITPGAALGVTIWFVASAAFFFYVSNFGNYPATYGAFAGAIILLLWLYITSIAFLLGGELNGALERSSLAGKGGPPPLSPPPSAANPTPPVTAPPAARDEAEA